MRAGGWGWGNGAVGVVLSVSGDRVSVGKDDKVLEMGGGG